MKESDGTLYLESIKIQDAELNTKLLKYLSVWISCNEFSIEDEIEHTNSC